MYPVTEKWRAHMRAVFGSAAELVLGRESRRRWWDAAAPSPPKFGGNQQDRARQHSLRRPLPAHTCDGALLRNPMPRVAEWPDLPRIQSRSVDQLAELLGFDRHRIIAWGIAQAVLSRCWSVEDGGDWRPAMAVAEALTSLRH